MLPLCLFLIFILFFTFDLVTSIINLQKSLNRSVIFRAAGIGTNQSCTGKFEFKQQNSSSRINEIENRATVEMRCDDAVIITAPSCLYFTLHIFSSIFRYFIPTNDSHEPCAAFVMMALYEQIKNLNL